MKDDWLVFKLVEFDWTAYCKAAIPNIEKHFI